MAKAEEPLEAACPASCKIAVLIVAGMTSAKWPWCLLAALIMSAIAKGQTSNVVDTSFTVYSAYVKALKTNPDIKIVDEDVTKDIIAIRDIAYCNRQGQPLLLDVFRPAKKRRVPYPAVLLIHGGGWRSGNRQQQDPMGVRLAKNGYVAVSVQYRLSGQAPYPAAVYDLKTAIRWMRSHATQYDIDTNKIAAAGCSAGGQLAALLGTTNKEALFDSSASGAIHSSDIQAIIDIDGILAFIHPESGEGDERKGPSAATRWFGGTRDEKRVLWEQASPLNHVSAATPPVLFINSGVARMHAGRDDMIRKLDSLHIYSEVHTFPDAPHPFWLFHPWFEPMMGYMLHFLKKVF